MGGARDEGGLSPSQLLAAWPVGRHVAEDSGKPFCRALSGAVDRTLRRVLRTRLPLLGEGACLVAQGGYGRRKLNPRSDVDVLALGAQVDDERLADALDPFFDELDRAGLQASMGHRSLADTLALASEDMKTSIALLDIRLLGGDRRVFDHLCRRLHEDIHVPQAARIVEFLGAEAVLRRERLKSHWYLLEPNLKLAEGGLRDVHSVRWIRSLLRARGVKVPRADHLNLREAHGFLLWLRNALHALTGWHQDQLTFEHQDAVVEALQGLEAPPFPFRRAEDLMRAYFLNARRVARGFRFWLATGEEALTDGHGGIAAPGPDRPVPNAPGTVVRQGRLAFARHLRQANLAAAGLRLFGAMARTGLPMHHSVHARLDQLPERPGPEVLEEAAARATLLRLITSNHDDAHVLDQCHDTGLLSRVLPEFEPLTGAFQRNIYHLYTVDVHSLRAIAELKRIAAGRDPKAAVATKVFRKGYKNDPAIFVAMLLHDLEKATGGDWDAARALLDAALARLGVDGETAADVRFLVQRHLLLALACQKIDLSDDQALLGLAREVGSQERLDRLYLVTLGDMRAVNPDLISSWQFTLLDTLYLRLRFILENGLDLWRDPESVVREQSEAAARAVLGQIPSESHPVLEAVRRHFARLPTRYAMQVQAADVATHMRLLEDFPDSVAGVALVVRPRRDGSSEGIYEVTVAHGDRPNFLSCVTAAFTVLGHEILEANVFSTLDGLALDSFVVQGPLDSDARVAALRDAVSQALRDPAGFERRVDARRKQSRAPRGPATPARVTFDDEVSSRYVGIEVFAPDRQGLLHDLCLTLTRLELDIHLARVTTEGPMARDVFLVSELDGRRPEPESRWPEVARALAAVTNR